VEERSGPEREEAQLRELVMQQGGQSTLGDLVKVQGTRKRAGLFHAVLLSAQKGGRGQVKKRGRRKKKNRQEGPPKGSPARRRGALSQKKGGKQLKKRARKRKVVPVLRNTDLKAGRRRVGAEKRISIKRVRKRNVGEKRGELMKKACLCIAGKGSRGGPNYSPR